MTRTCKYCDEELHYEPDHEYRKKFPPSIRCRMSFGIVQDPDGTWHHEFVWQCIRAHNAHLIKNVVTESLNDA